MRGAFISVSRLVYSYVDRRARFTVLTKTSQTTHTQLLRMGFQICDGATSSSLSTTSSSLAITNEPFRGQLKYFRNTSTIPRTLVSVCWDGAKQGRRFPLAPEATQNYQKLIGPKLDRIQILAIGSNLITEIHKLTYPKTVGMSWSTWSATWKVQRTFTEPKAGIIRLKHAGSRPVFYFQQLKRYSVRNHAGADQAEASSP